MQKSIETYVIGSLRSANEGMSQKDLIERLQSQYLLSFNESNKSYFLALIFSSLYAAKRYGVDLKLIFMNQTLLEIPNGEFFFAVGSLGALSYAAIKACDSHIYERMILAVCKAYYKKSGDLVGRSYIGGGALLHNVIDFMNEDISYAKFPLFSKISFYFFMLVTFVVSISPYVIGFDYVIRNRFAETIPTNFQLWAVAILTFISVLVGVATLNVHAHGKGNRIESS